MCNTTKQHNGDKMSPVLIRSTMKSPTFSSGKTRICVSIYLRVWLALKLIATILVLCSWELSWEPYPHCVYYAHKTTLEALAPAQISAVHYIDYSHKMLLWS